MEASADYHTCLKQLGLADRLPATIYDDMSEQLKGLSAEIQVCSFSFQSITSRKWKVQRTVYFNYHYNANLR